MLNLDTPILIFALGVKLRWAEQSLLARSRWSASSVVLSYTSSYRKQSTRWSFTNPSACMKA